MTAAVRRLPHCSARAARAPGCCAAAPAAAAAGRADRRVAARGRKRFAADRGLIAIALIIAVVGKVAALVAALLIIGLALPKLLLRRGDQPEIMLGVLIIVFGRDRISGTLRVAGKLKIFFGHMGGGSANFHVRPVGLVHARQWILVMTTFAVATAHSLVLTV